jgi:N-acetylglutamate synthase-like GNAT family acetyltransferase
MFITRATRHDKEDLIEFLKQGDWQDAPVEAGTAFIARDGGIVGSVRLVETAPQTVIIEEMLVHEDRRGEGIGRQVLQAAMNSRGGKLFLCCHDDVIAFYEKLGFSLIEFEDQPHEVQDYFKAHGDYPTDPGHVHYFMTAR